MGSNREKSNIAITILEKLPFLKGSNNIFADCIVCGKAVKWTSFVLKWKISQGLT